MNRSSRAAIKIQNSYGNVRYRMIGISNVVPLQCKQKGVCPEHISKASRNLIINFNNLNTMKDTKNKETLKTVLQFIVSVLTALLATLGVQSCISI